MTSRVGEYRKVGEFTLNAGWRRHRDFELYTCARLNPDGTVCGRPSDRTRQCVKHEDKDYPREFDDAIWDSV